MPGTDVPDPADRDDERDARELELGEAAAERQRIRIEEAEAEARAKAERLDELEAQAREDDAEHAAAGVGPARAQRAQAVAEVIRGAIRGAGDAAPDADELAEDVLRVLASSWVLNPAEVEEFPPLLRSLEDAIASSTDTIGDLFIRNLVAVRRPELDRLEAAVRAAAREAEDARDGEAGPLADHVRARMRDVVAKLATVRMQPGDFRDVSIGLAALGASLEDVESADGRRWLHEARLRKIAEDLQALLELVGEPDGHGEGVERAYWPVREDLDELRELAGADRREALSAGPGGGLLARLARAEAQRDAAHEEAAYRKRAEETLRDDLNRERRLLALKLGDLAHRLTGYRTADQPDRVIVNVAEDLDKLADDLGPAEEARG